MVWSEFSQKVGAVLARNLPEEVPQLVAGLLPDLLDNRDVLSEEHKANSLSGYKRNSVFLSPNDDFSILAVVWPPGIVSPIHNHQTWCTLGVFEGVIRETCYRVDQRADHKSDTVVVNAVDLVAGNISHMTPDGRDIHSMHNPTEKNAVTIHIYGGNSDKLGANVRNIYQNSAADAT